MTDPYDAVAAPVDQPAAPEPKAPDQAKISQDVLNATLKHMVLAGAKPKDLAEFASRYNYHLMGGVQESADAAAQGKPFDVVSGSAADDPYAHIADPAPEQAPAPPPVDPEVAKMAAGLDKFEHKYNAGDAFMQGASFGLKDEASGVGTALENVIAAPFSGHFDPAHAYQVGRDAERLRAAEFHAQHPIGSTVADIGGGLVSMGPGAVGEAGASLMARISTGAKSGAIGGAIAGAGYGEGLAGTTIGAGAGAAGGAALGAAVPVVGKVAADRIGGLARMLGKDPALPRRIVGEAIQADANTPAAVGAAMDAAHSRGSPMMLADTGENARGLLASVSRQPGPARTLARAAVIDRQEGQADRLTSAIESNLGPVVNHYELADQLMKEAQVKSAPLYDKFHAHPAVGSPELDSLLGTPAGRKALARARMIAANERRDPAELGFKVDAKGNVTLNPVRADLFGAQAQARSELQDAQEAFRASRTAGADREAARLRMEKARDAVRAADAALSKAPASGTAATSREYSPETMDYVKRGIDDVIGQLPKKPNGAPIMDENYRAVDGVRRQLLREMDRLNPDYAPARAAYAGPAAGNEALQKGLRAINKGADDISAQISRMTPYQLDLYKLGLRKAMADMVNNKGDYADKVHALAGTPKKRAVLYRLFGGENFDRFLLTLGDERAQGLTYKSVATGSQTAERGAADQHTNDSGLAETSIDTALRGAKHGLFAAFVNVLGNLRDVERFGAGEAGKSARERVAALLTETDPAALRVMKAQATRDIAARQVQDRIIAKRLQNLSNTSGRAVTSAVGSQLQQVPEGR